MEVWLNDIVPCSYALRVCCVVAVCRFAGGTWTCLRLRLLVIAIELATMDVRGVGSRMTSKRLVGRRVKCRVWGAEWVWVGPIMRQSSNTLVYAVDDFLYT